MREGFESLIKVHIAHQLIIDTMLSRFAYTSQEHGFGFFTVYEPASHIREIQRYTLLNAKHKGLSRKDREERGQGSRE